MKATKAILFGIIMGIVFCKCQVVPQNHVVEQVQTQEQVEPDPDTTVHKNYFNISILLMNHAEYQQKAQNELLKGYQKEGLDKLLFIQKYKYYSDSADFFMDSARYYINTMYK